MEKQLSEKNITRRGFIKGMIAGIAAITVLPVIFRKFVRSRSVFPAKPVTSTKNLMHKPTVVRISSAKATNWDYETFPYTNFIDQDTVNEMVSRGIRELTGQSGELSGWQQLMTGYKAGDKIVIKPNFNNIDCAYSEIATSHQVINTVLSKLIEVLGVPPKNIYIYDCSRTIYKWFKDEIIYPVNYVYGDIIAFWDRVKAKLTGNPLAKADTNSPINMREQITDKSGNPITCYMPKVVTQAQHLINIPILKSHIFILTSNALKNHFGTVRFSDGILSPKHLHGKVLQKSIVDINLNRHIKNKTRLIIVDGLFGKSDWKKGKTGPDKWSTFPGGITPNSLFLSHDPVAVESVVSDYIRKEREYHNLEIFPHEYLHDAMENNLGIHEHAGPQMTYRNINYVQIRT